MKPVIFFCGTMLGIWLVSAYPDIAQTVWNFGVKAWQFIVDGLANLSN